MTFFTPLYPKSIDTPSELINTTSPVVAQWLNQAATMVESIEAEIGSEILGAATLGSNSVRAMLDQLTNIGPTKPGRVVGVKRLTSSGNESFWNNGTSSVTFPSSANHNNWVPPGNKPGVCLGIYNGTNALGAMVRAQPIGNPLTGFGNQYIVRGRLSDASGDLISGTYTFDFLLIQLPEF